MTAVGYHPDRSEMSPKTNPLKPSQGIKNSFQTDLDYVSGNHYLCDPFVKNTVMANHASAKKRMRQIAKKRVDNRYYKKSTRTAIRKLRELTAKGEAEKFLPKVISMVDRLAKKNLWHKNKAANLKSKLMRHVASL